MDTAQYNPHCQPLRRMVNSLFEPNLGTSLDELIVRYVPREGFDEINDYYQCLTEYWNYLVYYTKALLGQDSLPEAPPRVPAIVKRALGTMRKIARVATSIKIGNPRAGLVEPHLGLCLQQIEMGVQKGLGCGHGLVAIFRL